MKRGRVALVGAGPGDPGLLTVRGRRLLRRADVVVYDRLVDRRLLDEAPSEALRIDAGKTAGHHALSQDEINAVLVTQACRGRRVVRLKGGDPFVFGRGGEEAEALARAGVPVEIVPGVSAAVAVPARAGIPLTHRAVSSSFAVVTGHEAGATGGVNWARLATAVDTIVVLMGAARLPEIARRLVAYGRAGQTPVALIRAGTTPDEQTIVTNLAEVAACPTPLVPPVVMVVGDVVAFRDRLAPALLRSRARGAQPPRYARRTWSLRRRSAPGPSSTIRPVSIT
jgi:uroporphyrin-III C-methyltransferase